MKATKNEGSSSGQLADSAFYQLVKLKLGRMLYGANPDSEDMDAGMGLALTVLTLPGAFLSLLLFNKYGSLLHFLRGQVNFDPYASSLPDEYLFTVLAMLVSGGIALWKWDTLFPGRRDLVNIVPLPVHTRQIFAANVLAILLFALVFCVDVNAASAVLFPLVVSASQESFLFFGKIALGHGLAILGASLLSFAAVFAVAGISMALLSARLFQALSLYIRGVVAVVLLLLFSNAFSVSHYIERGAVSKNSGLRYLPSIWFLGVCQWARGAADATFRRFAFDGMMALLLTLAVGSLAYAIAYRRHFSRLAEMPVKQSTPALRNLGSLAGHLLDRTVLKTPFEQAALRFIVRTLSRSDRHRAAVAVFVAVGFVAASQGLISRTNNVATPTTGDFATPLIILYCCTLGIRITFDMPVELNANWVFRFLIAPTLDECAVAAGKAIFLLVLPFVLCFSALFAFRWSVTTGLLEGAVLSVLSATLIAGLVLSFRKLPFTCAKAGFQQNALLKLLLSVLGVFVFSLLPAAVQSWSFASPVRLLILLPPLALLWWGIYEARAALVSVDRQITFHDSIQNEIELLNLNG